VAGFLLALPSALPVAVAQDASTRPVNIVLPLAAGSSGDFVARLIARELTARLHQTFVVENRPGAGAVIGTGAAARAPREGQTLLFAPSGALVINPTLYKQLPYDVMRDFTPIARTTDVPLLLVTHPSNPANNVVDVIAAARKRPGVLTYASSGHGASNHLAGELLQRLAGISLIHVPYRDSTLSLNDVVTGRVQMMFSDAGACLALIGAGKLKALAVSTRTRLAAAAEVPPLHEAGVPGFDSKSWHMLFGPAGMPDEAVRRLNHEINAVLEPPEVQQQFAVLGLQAVAGPRPRPEEVQAFLETEMQRVGDVIRQLGLAGSQIAALGYRDNGMICV
jgi:tripartite-type tricarboxylate transporter receptor subunit TctC